MKYRILGRTGLEVSEVGFGGIPILRLPTDEAVQILRYSFDKGITFYDTANAYRDSECKIGKAFSDIRHKVVIATKTGKRDADGALEHLENSLKMLQTDYIDLYQLHQVSREQDWQQLTGPEGALGALVKAKEAGKIRYIGITSHSLPMAVKLIKTDLFDTIQFPFNFIEDEPKDELHTTARTMNLGLIAMKPFAGGALANASLAFKFLRQYPDFIPIPGYDSIASVDEVAALYEQSNVVTEEDIGLMDKYRNELGKQFCRRCEYCQPCPNGVKITPAMGYPILVKRMSPQISVNFAKAAMETVPQCTDCKTCIERCPYELPIPEILKNNYDLFEQHRKSIG
ncbi:MAG TPA: aldo/keto reductase [Methylomusa anaerophila]|uniref:General stress protein 69 n=1 Tax=Methylomusa anaerophila TaxID=1930071 RepID=A0A348AEJ0_9FIRM|nr:aldo/keto reductase [Methylomusa anaerophila]BBB89488.1 general stress protein 69 [Methylomusa anaerophila]HML89719.1 aldo/keto reductase [Methylomusa anaerophila]